MKRFKRPRFIPAWLLRMLLYGLIVFITGFMVHQWVLAMVLMFESGDRILNTELIIGAFAGVLAVVSLPFYPFMAQYLTHKATALRTVISLGIYYLVIWGLFIAYLWWSRELVGLSLINAVQTFATVIGLGAVLTFLHFRLGAWMMRRSGFWKPHVNTIGHIFD